jgi:hypothetical protein
LPIRHTARTRGVPTSTTASRLDAADFAFTRSAWVDATPAHVYELISDVSAISHWSPTADGVSYDDGAGPWVGAPVRESTRADLDALRRYMAGSAETTLAALAQWIAEQQSDAFSGSRS